uniref:Uncharacterized protein n=1 Tax=Cannabis sativa TaxID=3483 RepID=A0A803PA17_CANSA
MLGGDEVRCFSSSTMATAFFFLLIWPSSPRVWGEGKLDVPGRWTKAEDPIAKTLGATTQKRKEVTFLPFRGLFLKSSSLFTRGQSVGFGFPGEFPMTSLWQLYLIQGFFTPVSRAPFASWPRLPLDALPPLSSLQGLSPLHRFRPASLLRFSFSLANGPLGQEGLRASSQEEDPPGNFPCVPKNRSAMVDYVLERRRPKKKLKIMQVKKNLQKEKQ